MLESKSDDYITFEVPDGYSDELIDYYARYVANGGKWAEKIKSIQSQKVSG